MTRGNTIRGWLLRHLAWLSLVPAISVSAALGAILLATIQEDLDVENRAFADAVVAEVNQLLHDPVRELTRLAEHLPPPAASDEVEQLLRAAVLSNLSFEALYLAGADNRVIAGIISGDDQPGSASELRDLDVSGWEHVQSARSYGEAVWSDTHLSALVGRITVAIAVPVGQQVLVGEIGLHRLSEFAQRVSASGHLLVVIVDRRGQVVAHPDPAMGLQQVNLSHLSVVRDGRAGNRDSHGFEMGGKRYQGTASRVEGPGWVAIVAQPSDHSQGQIDRASAVIVLAVMAIGLLSWTLASRLSRHLGEPLDALVGHAVKVSQGDYDLAPPSTPWPELDRLGDAMRRMVTSIVSRERALAATEDRYRALVDGIDDLIVQFDTGLVMQFCNPATNKLLERDPAACAGMPLLDVVHRDDRSFTRRRLTQWMKAGDAQLSLENRLVASGGAVRRVLWSLTKEYGEDGSLLGLRGIARDISDMRRGQDAMRGLVAATARQSGEGFFRSLVLHIARTLDVEHALVSRNSGDGKTMHSLAIWSNNAFRENFSYPAAGTPCEKLLSCRRGVLADHIEAGATPGPLDADRPPQTFLGATLRDSRGNGVGTLMVLAERDLTSQPELAQLISIFADRAAMELDRQQLEGDLRLAASVFENSAEGILITDAGERVISANAACEPITGYSPSELIGNRPSMLRSGQHADEFYRLMREDLARDGQWTGEIWNRRKNGEVYPQWMTITAVADGDGRIRNYIASFFDISARKEAEARIHFLAHHDALTGLPNRLLLQDRLNQALSAARRDTLNVAILFFDLDRFKLINDSLGHDFGDALLKEIAQRLSVVIREGETIARLGGDEFVVVLPAIRHSEQASLVAERILSTITAPMTLRSQAFQVTASVGISIYPDDGVDADTLLRNADTAMYHAKELGRNNFQFYTASLNAVVTERVQLENDMRRGLEQNEFIVQYQPQIDTRSGRIVGTEALVRWLHPTQGMISPSRFVPVAEDSGLIVPLGEFVMREACQRAAGWQHTLPHPVRVGVNISARQFSAGNLLETVESALAASGLRPDLLELEITESMLMEQPEDAARLLAELSGLGVQLAIDDFGTGYSSLAYLRRFAIDRLKVDQSFIQDLSHDANDAAIVRAVISLAHTLNLEVIAEGVETDEHLRRLHDWGCYSVQGYLFSQPLSAADFEAYCVDAQPLMRRWQATA
ncbi:MAG: EAL domain-containing protein [Rhodocyclaceae bacterium]|nr:EAL domain-containing protein [Rhodocyclaceae bacterium]